MASKVVVWLNNDGPQGKPKQIQGASAVATTTKRHFTMCVRKGTYELHEAVMKKLDDKYVLVLLIYLLIYNLHLVHDSYIFNITQLIRKYSQTKENGHHTFVKLFDG